MFFAQSDLSDENPGCLHGVSAWPIGCWVDHSIGLHRTADVREVVSCCHHFRQWKSNRSLGRIAMQRQLPTRHFRHMSRKTSYICRQSGRNRFLELCGRAISMTCQQLTFHASSQGQAPHLSLRGKTIHVQGVSRTARLESIPCSRGATSGRRSCGAGHKTTRIFERGGIQTGSYGREYLASKSSVREQAGSST